MRTYKLTVAYDGSRYQGWQRQPDTKMTIQGILEQAVLEEKGFPVKIDGSGRTDGGVHAMGQAASLVLPGKIDEEEFRNALNARLPDDIRIMQVQLMKNGFHARYSAKGKKYVYTVDTGEKGDVFQRKYAYHFPGNLNLQVMRDAADILEGRHDFCAFTDRKTDEMTTIRTIHRIEIVRQGNLLYIEYDGDGFMYHMVRILTGTILEAGSGRRKSGEIRRLLYNGERTDAGFLAPACGLMLKEVYY